jgi:hypothetical protein
MFSRTDTSLSILTDLGWLEDWLKIRESLFFLGNIWKEGDVERDYNKSWKICAVDDGQNVVKLLLRRFWYYCM